jgi:hypothetical protein
MLKRGVLGSVILCAFFGVENASADGPGVVVLNTFSKPWVIADTLGPKGPDGAPLVAKNTGCGIMDANVAWDQTSGAQGQEVTLGAVFTRTDSQPNAAGSYMQGGYAFAKLTPGGPQLGPAVDLPRLEGERAFMRPLIGFTPRYALIVAASEDNNSGNGNPKPIAILVDRSSGQVVQISNPNRRQVLQGDEAIWALFTGYQPPLDPSKPMDLVSQAQLDGVSVNDPDGQRGPHSMVPIDDHSFLIGMQHNNNDQEAMRVSVGDDASVHVAWLGRYSTTAKHNRPQVAYARGSGEAYVAAVEANNQPADIGIRLTKVDIQSGAAIASNVVIPSDPGKNVFVAEPSLALLGNGKLAIGYSMVSPSKNKGAGAAGHAGGAPVPMLTLFDTASFAQVGTGRAGVSQWSRHPHVFATTYGPSADLGVAVISGSSNGLGKGQEQLVPLGADGMLETVDSHKVYQVSAYSDVANLQARGKRNPNDQAKGFINGIGGVPNPGFTETGDRSTKFMPEVSRFSVSVITGFSGSDAAAVGKRESLWLSLVPAAWTPGIQTTPGTATDKPGSNPDGTGPAPIAGATPAASAGPPLAPSAAPNATPPLTTDSGGCGACAVGASIDPSTEDAGAIALSLLAGASMLLRRARRFARGATR